jgi:7-keto-8-aminopelargonate synthetase-like enzyme
MEVRQTILQFDVDLPFAAIILCSPTIRLYLINYARPLIYTTFMSHSSLIGIKNAYDWLRGGRTNQVYMSERPVKYHELTSGSLRLISTI